MSKRYDLSASASGGFSMQESEYGNWVTWGEHYKLQAENAKLKAENAKLREAAQAVVTQCRCKGSIWKQMDALAAALEETNG